MLQIKHGGSVESSNTNKRGRRKLFVIHYYNRLFLLKRSPQEYFLASQ